MTATAPDTSRVLGAVERFLPLIVLLLAGVLLGSDLNQGWVPHDEGALGQAADRILAGQVPHRDFDDVYTGGLAYLHAAFFKLVKPASTTMRMPLFLFAMLWVAAFHAIARRLVPPLGAAFVTITAVVWSVPNYPASMPSWFNLFFATFGTLALLRGLETRERRWLVMAGACGGLSFLFKLSGVFFLLGGGIALIATTFQRKDEHAGASRSGAVIVSLLLASALVVLAVPISRAGVNEVARFLLPLGLIATALVWREWSAGDATAEARLRALLAAIGPFVIGALLIVSAYAVILFSMHALPQTIHGVFVIPFKRLQSGAMHPPPPLAIAYALVLGLLLAGWTRGRGTTILAGVAAVAFAVLVYVAGGRPGFYGMAILAAWGLPFLGAAGAAWLIVTRVPSSDDRRRDTAIVITAVSCSTLLVEFPFAAPIYLLFTIPLAMLSLTAVVRAAGRTPLVLQLVVAGFLLMFGLVRVNPGTVESFGSRFVPTDETVRLQLDRGGLRVRAADAALYEILIDAVQGLSQGRTLWAGPDTPEIYFFSGMQNQTRTLFEFFDAGGFSLIDRIRASKATLVVLNRRPDFSGAPDQATIDALRADFPNARAVGAFLIFWR